VSSRPTLLMIGPNKAQFAPLFSDERGLRSLVSC
jgi:hypothetical protein